MRRALLGLVLLLAAAEMDALPSRRGARKIRVTDPARARLVRDEGGRLVADYGSFQLFEVDAARAPGLLAVSGVEPRDEEDLVLLNARTIDTREEGIEPAGAFSGRRLHLVQFAGPVKPEWHATLRSAGVQVVTYVPHNAYLVYGDDVALERLRSLGSFVQWVGPFRDQDRLHPETRRSRRRLDPRAPRSDLFAVQLVADAATNAATLRVLDTLRLGEVRRRFRLLGYENVIVRLDPARLAELAAQPDVVSIQPYVIPTKRDERQDQIMAGSIVGTTLTGPGYLNFLAQHGFTQAQFTASGFVVDVSDSGIDNGTTAPNHFGLWVDGTIPGASRVAYARLEGLPIGQGIIQGCDGHGNINAHIVAGFNALTGTTFEDAEGFDYGLGVAPFVRVGSSVIFDPDYTFPTFPDLQARAYQDGARISSNSWGSTANGTYSVDSQTFDALVRDAQPAGSAVPTGGNQQMVVIFAAGNSGPASTTTSPPGTAKNVITVGASENMRALGGNDGCGLGDAGADAFSDIASFSSRGPTADGRHKPDLVAPGTHITGGVFQAASPGPTGTAAACFDGTGVCGGTGGSSFFPAGQQFYTASSGTSHSTPAVAGAAALVRQDFLNHGMPAPSPAMTKAVLMNTARYITGAGAGGSLWSDSQGMGLVDLGAAFDTSSRILRDQLSADTFTATGQTRSVAGHTIDATKPLRVTLVWTDAPGSTAGNAYRNDLDLTVRVGGLTYRGNVFSGAFSTTGGVADIRNNVESVYLPAGSPFNFTVTVTASNINSDGVPNSGGALDQDFALVVYNGQELPVPNVVPAGSTLVAESCGNGNGAVDPGEAVTLNFALANNGTGDTNALVATLQPTGGVQSPSGPQSYGIVAAGGASVARPFTFTAAGTCGGTVTATLQLQDGGEDLGTVAFNLLLGAAAPGSNGTFPNPTAITIPTSGPPSGAASPYPSSVTVSGLTGTVVKVTATINQFSHQFPDDVDILLVGPGGQKALLLSDAGGGAPVSNLTLTFDDAAPQAVPDGMSPTSGTYRPSNYEGFSSDIFPAPAPAQPYAETLAAFNGSNPNGTWSLYVRDDFTGLSGSIAGGWSLSITTALPVCCSEGAPGITVTPTSGLVTTEAGSTATFTVVLNSVPSANVTIGLTSSDLTEGTVSPSALVFTSGDALTPKTVTVTGVDDAIADGNVGYTIVTAPAASSDTNYTGLDAPDVSVRNIDDDAPDLIFKDGFEGGNLGAWSTSSVSGGTLLVSGPAALQGGQGLAAAVSGAGWAYVQDDTPNGEARYRARFLFKPNGFDPGEGQTVRLFVAFDSRGTRTVALLLRRALGQYSVQAHVRLSSGERRLSPFFPVTDAMHALEFDWVRSSGRSDGRFQLWLDGGALATYLKLDNEGNAVDYVRLGVQDALPGAGGTLFVDRFESRRLTPIAP